MTSRASVAGKLARLAARPARSGARTWRATVVEDADGSTGVELDGGSGTTPASWTVDEPAAGSRVTVSVQGHRVTVTGVLSDAGE